MKKRKIRAVTPMTRAVFVFFISAAVLPLASGCSGPEKKMSFVREQNREKQIKMKAKSSVKKNREARRVEEEGAYIVEKGDTLWGISKKMYSSPVYWRAIAAENSLEEPGMIFPGKELDIPLKIYEYGKAGQKEGEPFVYRSRENNAWGVGEKLVYSVKYFMVVAGKGVLEVKGIEERRGRDAYYIEATAKTTPFFDNFHRVRDRIMSYMDASGLFSWQYKKKLEEGDYRANAHIKFYHEKGKAVKHNGKEFEVPAFTQDVLSELYYYRTFDLSRGKNKEVYIDVCSDEGKAYEILVKKLRYERVSVDAGEFDCVVVQPHLKYEGIFRQKGDVVIWLTDDKYKIPVLVKSKIVIGTIDAVLESATVVKPGN